jgi:hypothetical protein
MTATVERWDERAGRGWAVTTWPVRGRRVLLLRSEFRAASVRAGRERVGLAPGDSVTFAAVAQGGIARRIVRTETFANLLLAEDDDGHRYPVAHPMPPGPAKCPDVDSSVRLPAWPTPTMVPRRCVDCGRVFISVGHRYCDSCDGESEDG